MPNRIKTSYWIPMNNKKYFAVKILRSKYFLLFILDFEIQWDVFIWFGILVFFSFSKYQAEIVFNLQCFNRVNSNDTLESNLKSNSTITLTYYVKNMLHLLLIR